MGRPQTVLLVCAALLFGTRAQAQQMDYVDRQQIETAVVRLFDPAAAEQLRKLASAVMSKVGLSRAMQPDLIDIAASDFVTDKTAVIEMVDIRLLLTQIAIQTGAQDHVALVRAQGDRSHDVILLRGGFVTLSGLVALSEGTAAQDFIAQTPDGLVLTRPLAIWADAGLTLRAKDRLVLDRGNGSFIANLGWLDVSGTITGNNAFNLSEPAFRPFVLTAGKGSFTANDATFQALGFGNSVVFGGIVVVNSGLVTSRLAPFITESTLLDVGTLGLIGTTGAVVAHNEIAASTGTAVLISDSRNTRVDHNSLTALSGAQAIRVTAGSSNVQVIGNLLSGASRLGVLVDRETQDVAITGNVVIGSLTAGIAVDTATCVTITDNLLAANSGSGISLTDVGGATARGNAILFNGGSGVLLRDQAPAALVRIIGNVFIGNRDGLRGATSGQIALEMNDFDGQLPHVFAGDLAHLTVDWLQRRGQLITVSGLSDPTQPCTTEGNG